MADSHGRNVIIIIFLILVVALLAGLIPAIGNSNSNTETDSRDLMESESGVLVGNIEYTITNVNMGQDLVNLTVSNGEITKEISINESETQTVTLQDTSIDITNSNILTDNYAVIVFEYDTYGGWPNFSSFIVKNISIILLGIFVLLLVVGMVYAFEGDNDGF